MVSGTDFAGAPVTLESGGEPTVVIFLAHWCPHCQREVPVVQQWLDDGGLPEGTQILSVATGQDPTLPNFPPATWLEEEGWTPPVLVDDESRHCGHRFWAYELPVLGLPRQSAGNVAARASGELDPAQVGEFLASLP